MGLTKNVVGLATAALLSAAGTAQAIYVLQDTYDASNFFTEFEFFTGADPTYGFVQYVDNATASAEGLAGYSGGGIYMGVDHTTPATTNGRKSVRVSSTKAYTQGLVVLDANHLPTGCGTWPAFWMFGPNWPNSGEIDIIEGVNSQATDTITLHTGPGCAMSNAGSLASTTISTTDCNAGSGTAGCSQSTTDAAGYGSGFNVIGGGIYALEWTDSAISVWFFPRESLLASAIWDPGHGPGSANSSPAPDPTTWGTPVAKFSPDEAAGGCDMSSHFMNMNIVFDITLCGQWAGQQAVWSADATCSALASTCDEFVANNPGSFDDAYFDVNYIKVYQQAGSTRRHERVPRPWTA